MAGPSWVVQIYSVRNRAVQHLIVGRLRKIDGLIVEPTVSDRDVLVVVKSPGRPQAGWVSRTVHWIDPEARLVHSTMEATADLAARGQQGSPDIASAEGEKGRRVDPGSTHPFTELGSA
jgi:hypothetical protein